MVVLHSARPMKTIQIRCKGTTYLPLDSLKAFQGNLKTLSKPEYKKLWKSFEKHGFRFPVFTWQGHDCILDGHQRVFVLRDMVRAGWSVGPLPCVEIEAQTEKEAKELVLLISSRYGRVTDEGFYEFISTAELDFSALKETIDLPEIDLAEFQKAYIDSTYEKKEDKEYYTLMFTFLKDDAAYIQEKLHRNREQNHEELDDHWRERCLMRVLKKTD